MLEEKVRKCYMKRMRSKKERNSERGTKWKYYIERRLLIKLKAFHTVQETI